MNEIVVLVGYQASGKSTEARKMETDGYTRFSRDGHGGSVEDLVQVVDVAVDKGNRRIVIDNTSVTLAHRDHWIKLGRRHNLPVRCLWVKTEFDDALVNSCVRMYRKTDTLPSPAEIVAYKDPNMVPIAAMYGTKNEFVKPTIAEGFYKVDELPFKRVWDADHVNKALILDADSTLREVPPGNATKWPTDPSQVAILPNRRERIAEYVDKGYRLLGVSNMSGIAKDNPPLHVAEACYARTNELLGHSIEWRFCPHPSGAIKCYCRKPIPGHGVYYILKYKLDPAQCIFVGDQTTDRTFAGKCGFQYQDAEDFFR